MKTSKFDPEIEKIIQNNVKVFKETTAIIKAGYYRSPSGKRVDIDIQPMIDGGTVIVSSPSLFSATTMTAARTSSRSRRCCFEFEKGFPKKSFKLFRASLCTAEGQGERVFR